jgi:hypothetical protein
MVLWYIAVPGDSLTRFEFLTVWYTNPLPSCSVQFYINKGTDPLTLSDRAEYIYSATSHATSPDGVLVLHDFHNLVKKKVLKILDSGLYH